MTLDFFLVCFRYQTLASATDAETKQDDTKKVSGKRLSVRNVLRLLSIYCT